MAREGPARGAAQMHLVSLQATLTDQKAMVTSPDRPLAAFLSVARGPWHTMAESVAMEVDRIDGLGGPDRAAPDGHRGGAGDALGVAGRPPCVMPVR